MAAELPSSRYGRASDLRSDGSPLRETYLTFNLGPLGSATIRSAKLRLFVINGSTGKHNIKAVSDSHAWGEDTLSWSNRPAKGDAIAIFTPGPGTGVWQEVDVISAAAPRAGRSISLAIDTASADALHFNSREAAANPPSLIIEYSDGALPPPTPTPSPATGIRFGGSTTTVNTTASASIVIDTPLGTEAGDVLIASLAINGASVWSAPTGWVQIAAITGAVNPRQFAYYHVASETEPATYSWALNSSAMSSGGIARYTGVDEANPLDGPVNTANSSTAVGSLTVPDITTAYPGALIVGAASVNSSKETVLISAPGGMSERWDLGGKRHEYDDAIQSAAGASGSKTWSFSSARAAAAWLAALRPAP